LSRFLGLDWGEKRTGVAISDDRGAFAVGFAVWPTAELAARLAVTVKEELIDVIVMGMPLTLRGDIGPKAREVEAVIAKLLQAGYQVESWDERYTTQDASRALTEIGISQRKQRGKVDMSAAVLMLQSYLDSHRSGKETERDG
jgi:putative holliday junction resolvase